MFSKVFLDRVRSAYRLALEGFGGHGDSMWATIDGARKPIHDALMGASPAFLGALLEAPTRTKLYFGADELYDHGAPIGPAGVAHAAQMAHNTLASTAVLLGVWRCPNPEGGEIYKPGHAPQLDTEAILALLDEATGVELRFPNPLPGEIGLQTSRGIVSVRAAAALYQAARIKTLWEQSGGGSIVEIGGGMGRAAHRAITLGIPRFAIVDLPLSLVGQAAFLAATLGEERVRFAGEPDNGAAICLATPEQFHAAADPWRIVLNVDSLPEMDIGHARAYLGRLERDRALLLSINHEANRHTVAHLTRPRFRTMRAPCMARPGYMEEVYDFRVAEPQSGIFGHSRSSG